MFTTNAAEMEEHRRAMDRAVRRERQRRKEGEGEIKLARALVKGKKTRKDEREEFNAVVSAWVADIRTGFEGAVVRRTVNSLDWLGRPISGLEPYHEHPLLLELSPTEHEVLNGLAEEITNEGVGASAKNLQVRNPFLRRGSRPQAAAADMRAISVLATIIRPVGTAQTRRPRRRALVRRLDSIWAWGVGLKLDGAQPEIERRPA